MTTRRINDTLTYEDDAGDRLGAPVVVSNFPSALLSDADDGYPRLRVDTAQTGFYAGREFRMFYEYSIPTGQSLYIRATVSADIILFSTNFTLDGGLLRVSLRAGGTGGGTWTPATVLPKNNMTGTPVMAAQVAIHTGGTHSGGTLIDVARLASENTGHRAATVGGRLFDERGVAPGVYYYQLENLDGVTATGVMSAFWEQR